MKMPRRTLLKLVGGGAILGSAGILGRQFVSKQQTSKAVASDDLLAVKVKGIYVDPVGARVVLLAPDKGKKALRVWIGDAEAMAIATALKGITLPRPMTHDLLNTIINGLGGKVERVVITDLYDNTFFATIHVRDGGKVKTFDARPSDSIALALRAKAPILLTANVQKAMSPLNEGPTPSPTPIPRKERQGIKV